MKEINILKHQKRSIINRLDNNLLKQKDLQAKANALRVELISVCNKIFEYNHRTNQNG